MRMTEIIAVINQKGGVGKSTTANSLGAGLQRKGFKVLYIDLDPQGNLSHSMGAINRPVTSLQILTETNTVAEAIVKTPQGDLIASSPALASADALITDTGKEFRLQEALESVKEEYDYIVLDTPPTLGIITVNALTTCNKAIVPAQADIYSWQGITQLKKTVKTVKRYCNPKLTIDGILITRHNQRTVIGREMVEKLEDTAAQFAAKVYQSKVRENIAVKEAQLMQQDIFTYAPKSNAALDYQSFVDEFIYGSGGIQDE